MSVTNECREIFLIVPPGFEKTAAKELKYWLGHLPEIEGCEVQTSKGGVACAIPLSYAFNLHRYLKVPTRILLRIDKFRCRDFVKFYKKINKINWNKWIGGCSLRWKVSSRSSRLKIEDRIEQTCKDAFLDYRKGHEAPKQGQDSELEIFVRFLDDECELSINLSGEALYKRGGKRQKAVAPIRENLAAALIWELIEGEDRSISLIDPMMGTGTFLKEAVGLFRSVETREFGFSKNPIWKNIPYNNLKEPETDFRCERVIGRDIEKINIEISTENLSSIANQLDLSLDLRVQDVLEPSPEPFVEGRRLVISNLPYGERVKARAGLKNLYRSFLPSVLKSYQPSKIGIVISRAARDWLKVPEELSLEKEIVFSNGGIAVIFLLFQKDPIEK